MLKIDNEAITVDLLKLVYRWASMWLDHVGVSCIYSQLVWLNNLLSHIIIMVYIFSGLCFAVSLALEWIAIYRHLYYIYGVYVRAIRAGYSNFNCFADVKRIYQVRDFDLKYKWLFEIGIAKAMNEILSQSQNSISTLIFLLYLVISYSCAHGPTHTLTKKIK